MGQCNIMNLEWLKSNKIAVSIGEMVPATFDLFLEICWLSVPAEKNTTFDPKQIMVVGKLRRV